MAVTQITTREVGSVQRNDMDVTTTGQAVITKLVAGTGISLSSTGADAGTGDVTVNVAVVSGRVPFGNTSGVIATSANFLWDDSTNTFSVTGTANVVTSSSAISAQFIKYQLNVVGDNGSDNGISIMNVSSVASTRPVLLGQRGRGTVTTPTAVASGDWIFGIVAGGFDSANARQTAAAIEFKCDGTPTAGNVPMSVEILTGTNGGNRAARIKADSAGNVTISSLAGTGSRMVVADATGVLSTQAIPSGGGTTTAGVMQQLTITGTKNNSNRVFTLSAAPDAGAVYFLFHNQLKLVQGVDYTVSGTTLTLDASYSPAPYSTDTLEFFVGAVGSTGGGGTQDVVKLVDTTAFGPTASLNLNLSSYVSSTYKRIEVVFLWLITDTDSVDVFMRTSADGTTFDSGSFTYVYGGMRRAGAFSGSTDHITIIPNAGTGSATGQNFFVTVKLLEPATTTRQGKIEWIGGYFAGSSEFGNPSDVHGFAKRGTAAALKGIQVYPTSGNIQGEYQVYGYK